MVRGIMAQCSFIHSRNIGAIIQCSLPPQLVPSLICSPSIARMVLPKCQWVHDACEAHKWLLIILKTNTKTLQMIYRNLRGLAVAHPSSLIPPSFSLLKPHSSFLRPLDTGRPTPSTTGLLPELFLLSGMLPWSLLVSFYFRSQAKCGFLRRALPDISPASVTLL